MDPKYLVADIQGALQTKAFPTILSWNRLEGRPRTHDFSRALRAEVRDALWMLTRQWQMGEFKGDDAGSPVLAQVHVETSALDQYQPEGRPAQAYDANRPLETKAEQKKIPFLREGLDIQLDIRLQMGRYWSKLLSSKGRGGFFERFIQLYGFLLPDKDRDGAAWYAHPQTWQKYAAVSGRNMDGYKLYVYLKLNNANKATDNLNPLLPPGNDRDIIDDLGEDFKTWFEELYEQPEDEKDNAWVPEKLEYKFQCSAGYAGATHILDAEEYYQGRLDWYSFNAKTEALDGMPTATPVKHTQTMIPRHVEFEGMPNTRWWKMEDAKTNIGGISPSVTDLSKLLLMEFAMVYSNDWFLIPFTLPVGSLAFVRGIAVTNNFGERTWVEDASRKAGNDWKKWTMFHQSSLDEDAQVNPYLFLAPAAINVLESEPVERVHMIRDEMANMVWGVESVVTDMSGKGQRGHEAGLALLAYHQQYVERRNRLIREVQFYLDILTTIVGPLNANLTTAKGQLQNLKTELAPFNLVLEPIEEGMSDIKVLLEAEGIDNVLGEMVPNDYVASVYYQAMTSVPEHWIPFVPVHKENSNREVQLQRSSMLRVIEKDPAPTVKVKPLNSLMRFGLDETPKKPYYLFEEEVPRAGVQVMNSFQRARWVNGEVFVWLGSRKASGRGEGSSGLAFDQIQESK